MKKPPLPITIGLITASLDLVFWIWFIVYGYLNQETVIYGYGLFMMMILHLPASTLLPVYWSFVSSFFTIDNFIIPQTIFLFVAGITQYFVIGYLLGKLIVFIRKKKTKIKE